jgi:hypothetical protein
MPRPTALAPSAPGSPDLPVSSPSSAPQTN